MNTDEITAIGTRAQDLAKELSAVATKIRQLPQEDPSFKPDPVPFQRATDGADETAEALMSIANDVMLYGYQQQYGVHKRTKQVEGNMTELAPGTKVVFVKGIADLLVGPYGTIDPENEDLIGKSGVVANKMSDQGYEGTGSDWYIIDTPDMAVEAQLGTHFEVVSVPEAKEMSDAQIEAAIDTMIEQGGRAIKVTRLIPVQEETIISITDEELSKGDHLELAKQLMSNPEIAQDLIWQTVSYDESKEQIVSAEQV